jgi:[ribosomal protein S18]-alanine N-acetyltransferase
VHAEIHSAGPAETELLATLHGLSFTPQPGEDWSGTAIAELLQMPGASALLATRSDDSTPLGFVIFRTVMDEGEIISLGVVPEARRLGVASRLLTQTLRLVAREGVAKMFLEVAVDNQAALPFYRAHNFVQIGIRSKYYRRDQNERIDALILQTALATP